LEIGGKNKRKKERQ